MLPYYILVLLPIYIFLFEKKFKLKKKNLSILIFFMILIILLSLRNIDCGIDLRGYSKLFYQISMLSFKNIFSVSKKGEFSYYILNKLVSFISTNFQFFLTVVALITMIPIYILYRKKSQNQLLTIALFLTVCPFNLFFSGLRQALAISFIIIAFSFIEKKMLSKFIITIIIASFFHKSALFCLILYPLYHAKITRKWLYIIIPLMILIFIYNKQIFSYTLPLLFSNYSEYYNVIQSTGAYSILFLLLLFDLYCFLFPKNDKITSEFIGLRNFLLLSTCIQMFASINVTVMRINYYVLMFIPILIPMVKNNSSNNYKGIINLSIVVMCTFFYSYFFYNAYFGNDVLNIYPYIPFWR